MDGELSLLTMSESINLKFLMWLRLSILQMIVYCAYCIFSKSRNGGSGGISDEMDIILLLTDANCYVVNYDDELDCLTDYQRISLADLYAIDVGKCVRWNKEFTDCHLGSCMKSVTGLISGPTGNSVFRSKQQCIRLWYKYHGDPGYFHTFRIPNVRAFNNTVIEIKSEEEAKGMFHSLLGYAKI